MPQSKIKHPEDLRTIDLRSQVNVESWCNILNCRPADLARAVHAVGTSADAVKNFISSMKRG